MELISSKDLIEGDIFELMGLNNIEESKKEALMEKMLEGLQNRVILRIDDAIPENEKEQFQQLLDNGDDDKIKEYLTNKNIDISKLTAEEALLMKNEIIQNAKTIKE
jgi:hypothetical protein